MLRDRAFFSKTALGVAFVAALLLAAPVGSSESGEAPVTIPNATEEQSVRTVPASFETEAGLSYMERRVRSAAVKVLTPRGHGSGSYMVMNGFRIVVTAQHVVSQPVGTIYRVSNPAENEVVGARLVYSDPVSDIAVLLVPEMRTRVPMQFRLRADRIPLGTNVSYAGHPSRHSLLSFRGMVSGYENEGVQPTAERRGEILILHSYGWPGCSGSVLFDNDGYIVGVLWGVSAGNVTGAPQIIEDLIWASPASVLSEQQIISSMCSLSPRPERCARFTEQ